MHIRLIYIGEKENRQINLMLKESEVTQVTIDKAEDEQSFISVVNQSDYDLAIVVGGFYSGIMNAASLLYQEFALETEFVDTAFENYFESGVNVIKVPKNANVLTNYDGVVWGYIFSHNKKKVLHISEPQDELLYKFSGEFYTLLNELFSSAELNVTDEHCTESFELENSEETFIADIQSSEELDIKPFENEGDDAACNKSDKNCDFDNSMNDINAELNDMLDKLNFKSDDDEYDPLLPIVPESALFKSSIKSDSVDDLDVKQRRVKVKRKINKIAVSLILVAFIIIGSISSVFGYRMIIEPGAYDSVMQRCQALYGTSEIAELSGGINPKFKKLYLENEDIAGWVIVPNTSISYPIVYAKKDEKHYQNRLFDGRLNRFGTPHFSSSYKKGEFNYNSVIYANNSNDKRNFSELINYTKLDFYNKSKLISMDTINIEGFWKVSAVIVFDPNKGFNPAKNYFFDSDEFQLHIDNLKKYSMINTSVDINSNDEIVTLITDYNDKAEGLKLAVVGRRVRIGEDNSVDNITAQVNDDVVYPTKWYTERGITVPDKVLEAAASQYPDTDSTTNNSQSSGLTIATTESTAKSNGVSSGGLSSSNNSTSATNKTTSSKNQTTSTTKATTKPTTKATTTTPSTTKPTQKPTTGPTTGNDIVKIRAKNQSSGEVLYDDARVIVAKILEAEMGSGYELEALKAQAVAAYTWLLYNGAANGSAPSAPMKNAGARATQAAEAVAGELLKYNGAICNSTYYAMSAGKTANCNEVWSADLTYLRSVDSSVDRNASGFQTTRTYKAADIASWVKSQYSIDLNKVTDKAKWFVPTYDSNNLYVKSVSLGGLKTVKGIDIRYNLITSSRAGSSNVLRSHAFTISYSSSSDSFTFVVKGYGHGVGMSQVGANLYAKNGWNYKKILEHYFTGASITK